MRKESGVTKLVAREVVRIGCWTVATALSLVVSSCSSRGMPRPTVPSEERAVLDLAPDDAYFGVRVDLRAARETPHWQAFTTLLAASGLKDAVPHLGSTDRVWLLLGGLVEAPTFAAAVPPPEALDEEESEEDADADEGYPDDYGSEMYPEEEFEAVTEPAWAGIARVFGGRLPRAVIVVDGSAAAVCATAVEGQALRRVRGYQLGVVNGIAVLLKDRRCVLTPEPVLDSLLQQDTAARTDVMGMLSQADAHGTGPILSYVVDYSAPAYAASTELQLTDARATVDAEHARLAELEAATPWVNAGGPEGSDFARNLTLINAVSRNIALWTGQTTVFALEASRITTRGLLATSVRLSHTASGYELRGRCELDSDDRATMWRELGAMYVEVARVAVDTYDIPAPYKAALAHWLGSTRFEEERDGFSYHAQGSDQLVSSVLTAVEQAQFSVEAGEGPAQEDATGPLMAQLQVVFAVEAAEEAAPQEAIAGLEPHIEAMLADDEQNRSANGLTILAEAYDSVGRHDEAVALLQRGVDRWREVVLAAGTPLDSFSGPRQEMCELARSLCEQQLRWGFAEAAEVAARVSVSDTNTCADVNPGAFFCQQLAVGQQGRASEALEHVDEHSVESAYGLLPTRAQLLIDLQQHENAYQVIRSGCAGPLGGRMCYEVHNVVYQFLTHAGANLADWDAVVDALRVMYPGAASLHSYDDHHASSLAVADCARRVRLAPRASETVDACNTARDVADRLHGTSHAASIAARVYLARALLAARRSEEHTVIASELEASRALVGPQHVLHRPTAPAAAPRRR